MTEQKIQNLTIKFGDCNAGWISMRLTAGEISLRLRLSHVYDPLPDMLAWLESIVIGVEECGFRVDEEGAFVNFSAHKQWRSDDRNRVYTELNVKPQYDVPPLQAIMPTTELVAVFYHAFRAFADSPEYVREQWERITLEDLVNEQLGMTATAWIDSVISLEPRELQKAFWKIDPCIERNPQSYMDDIGTEAELMELTGKTRAETGGVPRYCLLPHELWGRYAKRDVQAQREYLEEYLSDPFYFSWAGTPWRKMRSSLIESWLVSESPAPHSYWERWLT